MTEGYIQLSVVDLVIGLALVAVSVGIAWAQRFGVMKDLLWGVVRASFQLTAMGLVLTAVFELKHPAPLIGVLVVMATFGGWEAGRRAKRPIRRITLVAVASIAFGASLVIAYTLLAVVRVEPWYAPRYLIPIAGMIIAYAMNSVSLVVDRMTEELHARIGEVEALLCLGASPRRAARSAMNAALRTAWMPIINHLMIVGVVQLPGMMTGQIIAGASPLDAVRYQIMVSFMLLAVVALSTYAAVELAWRQVFDAGERLHVPGEKR